MKWFKYISIATIGSLTVMIGMLYPDKIFSAFIMAWIVLIPMAAIIYLAYGLKEYIKERRNSILISIKPNNLTEKLIELTHKEREIKEARDAIYKEMKKDKFYKNSY